jgi:methyl-accepting chemotaxis protein
MHTLASNISTVSGAIDETNRSAGQVRDASGTVSDAAQRLPDEVRSFFIKLRTGPMDRRAEPDPTYRVPSAVSKAGRSQSRRSPDPASCRTRPAAPANSITARPTAA